MTTSAINLKISRDTNGNKTLQVKRLGYRGFSVETNGKLKATHNYCKGLISDDYQYCIALMELTQYITEYGTVAQQALIKGK